MDIINAQILTLVVIGGVRVGELPFFSWQAAQRVRAYASCAPSYRSQHGGYLCLSACLSPPHRLPDNRSHISLPRPR